MRQLSTSGYTIVLFSLVVNCIFLCGGINVITDCLTPGHLAITFDDGPHPTLTPQVLDLFKSYNLTTTFFVTGLGNWEPNTTRYMKAIVRAYNEGHQIGSHSWSHPDLGKNATAETVRSELRQIADLIREILGKNMTIFRPPFGSFNDQLLQIAQNEFGYAVVNWNIDTNDWDHPNDIDAGFQPYVDAIESGNYTSYIGLHHDWTNGVVQLANRTIQYVQANNLTIVSVAECIGVEMYIDTRPILNSNYYSENTI